MNYLTLDLDNGDLVLSDNSVWKSLNTWLDGGTLYSDYYDASNCGDFWVASTHWISIDSESTYLTFTIEYEFIDATATDSCLCQIKFDGFEDGGVAVTADSSGLNISTDASKHINCDYSNANIKIDITVNLLTKEITTYIHKDNEPLAKKVNVSNYSFTEFIIQAGSRGDIVYKLPTTTKLLNVSVSDVAVSYSNFPETIDYIDKLGLARIWANIKSYISSQLLGKSDTGHTHVSSDVTDLLSDTHTWTSQQSYNSDLNLNYASTDVDDIVNSVAGSATLDNFVHMTGNETVSGIKSFPDGIVANVTGSATSATNDGSGNVISSTYGSLTGNNTWSGSNTFSTGGVGGEVGIGTKKFAIVNNTTANYEMTASDFANKVGFFKVATFKENTTSAPRGNTGDYDIISMSINTPYSTYLCASPRNDILWYGKFWNSVWQGWKEVVNCESTQTITGEKTFQRYVSVYSNTLTRGTIPSENAYCTLGFKDSGGNSTARILRWINSDGYNGLTIECWDAQVTTDKTAYFQLAYDTQGNGYSKLGGVDVVGFIPGTDNSVGLGTSTNRWKSFNGLNPGTLSIPDYDSNAKLNFTSTFPAPDAGGNIRYTPTMAGWLYVYFDVTNATTGDNIFYAEIKDSDMADANAAQIFWRLNPAHDLPVFFPVVANKQFIIQINFTGYTVKKALLIPGLGHVA